MSVSSSLGIMVVVTLCCGACSATRRGAWEAPTPRGAAVTISMQPPRELLELTCGDEVREYRRVLGITGRVRWTAGDTLEVGATSLQIEGASQDVGVKRGCLASVVRDQYTSVHILSRQPGRIEAALGIGVLAFVVAILVFSWAIAQGN